MDKNRIATKGKKERAELNIRTAQNEQVVRSSGGIVDETRNFKKSKGAK